MANDVEQLSWKLLYKITIKIGFYFLNAVLFLFHKELFKYWFRIRYLIKFHDYMHSWRLKIASNIWNLKHK